MTSSLRTIDADTEREAYSSAPYFGVSLSKLVVMSLCTFGLYELYWCYRQWDAERKRSKEDLSAFWRALFAPLWGFSLFRRIQRASALYGVPAAWSPVALGVAFLFFMGLSRLPDPYWLLSLLSFLPLLVVQHAVNQFNATVAPEAPRNTSYSGANVAVIVLGAVLLVLAILGTVLPPETIGSEAGSPITA